MITPGDVKDAHPRIKDVARRTPLVHSRTLSEKSGINVYLKLENLQRTGSFKVRGSANRIAMLTPRQREKGVVAASAGNHAQAVAMTATRAGVASTIVMPMNASLAKVEATMGYGARVLLDGKDIPGAVARALEIAAESGAEFIHPYDDPLVVAGQGTVGLEIIDQMAGIDAIIVPVGGGGLIGGVAIAVKELNPDVLVYGVQPENSRILSGEKGHFEPRDRSSGTTIADGLDVGVNSQDNMKIINEKVDGIVFVSEEEIASSVLMLLERTKMLVEGAGACSVAAVLYKKMGLEGKKVVCLLSGGNIDVPLLDAIIKRGLAGAGRYLSISTVIPDSPGELSLLTGVIARTGANVHAVKHDRRVPGLGVRGTFVELELETSGPEHSAVVLKALRDSGYEANIR